MRRGKPSGGRSKSFKKGAGRLVSRQNVVLPNPATPFVYGLTRKKQDLAQPPMGRVYASQGNLYQEGFYKITGNWVFTEQTGNANPMFQNLCASDFFAIGAGGSYIPNCVDMYRSMNGWRSITVLGIRMELFGEPAWVTQAYAAAGTGLVANMFLASGLAWSTISKSGSAIIQYGGFTSTIRPTPDVAANAYTNQVQAEVDPTYRSEKFKTGYNTTHQPAKPVKFFDRFTPLEYYKTAHEGANPITPSTTPFTVPPTLGASGVFNQYDTFVQYVSRFSQSSGSFINFMLRGTCYIRVCGRYPNTTAMYPVYMVAPSAIGTSPSGNGT